MKLDELRRLIREEVRRVINENNTKPTNEIFTDLYDTAWQLYSKVRNYALKNPQKISINDLNDMISTIIKDLKFKGNKTDFANLPDNSASKLIKLFNVVLKKREFKYINWNPKTSKWQKYDVSTDDLWY
jgi:glutamyl-tRNA reductase